MKGIFVIMLALCLGACASQPQRTVTADQPLDHSVVQAQPSQVENPGPSKRVYLDDYQLVPVKAPYRPRSAYVLGKKKG